MSTAKNSDDFGTLHDYATGDYIREATRGEQRESVAAGDEGVIMVGGVRCYVVD